MKGSELAALREALGLNQSQAAEYIGVDRSSLSRWEKNEHLELPRLAAAGAAAMLRQGPEFDEWISSLKPAAARAIQVRAAEYNERKGVDNGKTDDEELRSEETQQGGESGISACSPGEGAEVEQSYSGEVVSVAEATDSPGDSGIHSGGGGVLPEVGDGDAEKDVGQTVNIEERNRARWALRSKMRMFGAKPRVLRDLSTRADVPAQTIQEFIYGDGSLTDGEFESIMNVLRETEGV